MVLTESTMLSLGTPAPDFALPDVTTQETVSLKTFAGKKGLLVMFICNHCPFVKHIKQELVNIGKDYVALGLGIVGISSNDVENYPDDSPEKLKAMVHSFQMNFPICYDESQAIAQKYKAACTPDFFLFDAHQRLAYRGQLDGSRPSNDIPVTGEDLRSAIDAVLGGKSVILEQKPSIGCNIKWKAGSEPNY